jgi:hypothetical protein
MGLKVSKVREVTPSDSLNLDGMLSLLASCNPLTLPRLTFRPCLD